MQYQNYDFYLTRKPINDPKANDKALEDKYGETNANSKETVARIDNHENDQKSLGAIPNLAPVSAEIDIKSDELAPEANLRKTCEGVDDTAADKLVYKPKAKKRKKKKVGNGKRNSQKKPKREKSRKNKEPPSDSVRRLKKRPAEDQGVEDFVGSSSKKLKTSDLEIKDIDGIFLLCKKISDRHF